MYILSLSNKYGNWVFESEESYLLFQDQCSHPTQSWICSPHYDYLTCDRCGKVELEKMNTGHPELSRWVTEGGRIEIE